MSDTIVVTIFCYSFIQESKLQFKVNKYFVDRVHLCKHTVCKTIQKIRKVVQDVLKAVDHFEDFPNSFAHCVFAGMNPIPVIFVDLELEFRLGFKHFVLLESENRTLFL